jgi:paraquat-inducible protein A
LERIIGCHDCDAILPEPEVPDGGAAICGRCGGVLFRRRRQTVEITLALTLAAAILFIVANSFPFLSLEIQGQSTQTTLASGSRALWDQGRGAVAMLVFLTTILAPMVQISLMLYVLTPLHLGARAPGTALAFRLVETFRPWSMMEVFLIGTLVALVKLVDMADILPGLALWAFALLIPTLAGASAFLDAETVWRRIEIEP